MHESTKCFIGSVFLLFPFIQSVIWKMRIRKHLNLASLMSSASPFQTRIVCQLNQSPWNVTGESPWDVTGESPWDVTGESPWDVTGESPWDVTASPHTNSSNLPHQVDVDLNSLEGEYHVHPTDSENRDVKLHIEDDKDGVKYQYEHGESIEAQVGVIENVPTGDDTNGDMKEDSSVKGNERTTVVDLTEEVHYKSPALQLRFKDDCMKEDKNQHGENIEAQVGVTYGVNVPTDDETNDGIKENSSENGNGSKLHVDLTEEDDYEVPIHQVFIDDVINEIRTLEAGQGSGKVKRRITTRKNDSDKLRNVTPASRKITKPRKPKRSIEKEIPEANQQGMVYYTCFGPFRSKERGL